jgi:NAD(P)-dependent dehydrogenase (short-subunit alcohol dehydrogenase family)
MDAMSRLENKTAVVTGGTRGLGRAIAERFLAEGARVVIAGRGGPGWAEGAGDALHFKRADVARADEVAALFAFAEDRLGRVDILVNNAGIEIEKFLEETSEEEWDALMGVNVKGVFLCCRAAIPVMRRQGGGSIINLGSISGTLADAGMPLYNTSKGAVHALTRSIAVDHGADGIRCNAICPGWIKSDMLDQTFSRADDPAAAEAAAARLHPLGRIGRPADIANMALWLASDEAGFASGQLFTIDGALTAGAPFDPAA